MKKVKKANTRDKAWLGAVIGGVANIATSLISSYQQEQAQKKELAAQQRMQQQQNIANANIAAQQQAGAMTNALANQNYVDEYKNKIVMKNGGFYDRLSKDKAIFKCGGKKKKAAGGTMDGGDDKNKKRRSIRDIPLSQESRKKIDREHAQNRVAAKVVDKTMEKKPLNMLQYIVGKDSATKKVNAEDLAGSQKYLPGEKRKKKASS